jgi:hypothetical protein
VFTVSKVLRQTPKPLLREFFVNIIGNDLGLPLAGPTTGDLQPILEAVDRLPPAQFNAVEAALHAVFDLACPAGRATILETSRLCGAGDLTELLPGDGGQYGAAMWTWLNRPQVFRDASTWHFLDCLPWWRRRNDLPCVEPRLDRDTRHRLGREISAILMAAEGRGRNCTIDVLTRGQTHYFCNYVDDYVASEMVHDEGGVLVRQNHRPTFEVVFAYEAAAGALEVFAHLPRALKTRLEEAFADLVLDHQLGPWCPAYALDHLIRRSFELTTDPEDAVLASVRSIRFRPYGTRQDVTLTADPEDGPWAIYDMLDEYINWRTLHIDALEVRLVKFLFEFEEVGDRREGTLTFDVAVPRSCGLRNQRQEFIAIAQKYLARWGVQVNRSAQPTSPVAA